MVCINVCMYFALQVLLALERIEQEEEMTNEVPICLFRCCIWQFVLLTLFLCPQQILALENSLYLSGLILYDQHRDLRLDIDDMSYEVVFLFSSSYYGLMDASILLCLFYMVYSLVYGFK